MPGDTEDFGKPGSAPDQSNGGGDGLDPVPDLVHVHRGKSELPAASTDNYGDAGKGNLHINSMEKDSLGARIRKAREAVGLSQTALGRPFGITRNAVSLWETDVNAPTTDKIATIAALTRVSVGYLLSGEATNVKPPEIPNPIEMPRDVPVLGIAACGEDGAFVFESTTIDWAKRPPRIKGLPDIYALYVQGSSMSPWREEGETVYVNPKQTPQIGDYVVVQTGTAGKPTAAYIKRLVKRTATEIKLKQYEPAEEFSIPLRKVISIHRILNYSEMLA